MSVLQSTMLYGAEVWADALSIETYRKKLATVQRRGALRITSAYRTVSECAVLTVAGIPPIDLLALERKRIYSYRRNGALDAAMKRHEKAITQALWKERNEVSATGIWTK
ncbi:uncharacterized protein LOC130676891 [Microplitis mediator]|uniref:uncharacterized protein LOC130676891 n=1 Tax=Microplitis mediator TaxID=375433 RepID=UPI00255481F6|nr:uncharacterized protein LOC130676891 [Microplitis mediator]